MPPKAAKRATAGRGRKRAVRGRGRVAEAKLQTLPDESTLKAEEEEVEFVGEKEKEMEPEEAVKAAEGKGLEENRDAYVTSKSRVSLDFCNGI